MLAAPSTRRFSGDRDLAMCWRSAAAARSCRCASRRQFFRSRGRRTHCGSQSGRDAEVSRHLRICRGRHALLHFGRRQTRQRRARVLPAFNPSRRIPTCRFRATMSATTSDSSRRPATTRARGFLSDRSILSPCGEPTPISFGLSGSACLLFSACPCSRR